MEQHIHHLKKDKILASIMNEEISTLHQKENIALQLMSAIMSQQLSTKVAKVIYHRFLELFDGTEPLIKDVLKVSNEALRSIGLSYKKVEYIKNVADFFNEHSLNDEKIRCMDDEAVVNTLSQIKGVGRWTAEMILMFSLGRPDVFAVDDLGIQQSMKKLYTIDAANKKELQKKMMSISKKWSPYRTYACMYLWNWKDADKK